MSAPAPAAVLPTAPGPTLRDIHLPPAPDWWPPAPGWWLLALLALAGLVFALYTLRQAARRRRWRRAVLAEFERSVAAAGADRVALAAALSQFLRRLVLRAEPAAAALHGEAWLAYLDRSGGSDEFCNGIGRVLLEAPFRTSAAFDAPALVALARRWTRQRLDTEARRA